MKARALVSDVSPAFFAEERGDAKRKAHEMRIGTAVHSSNFWFCCEYNLVATPIHQTIRMHT